MSGGFEVNQRLQINAVTKTIRYLIIMITYLTRFKRKNVHEEGKDHSDIYPLF